MRSNELNQQKTSLKQTDSYEEHCEYQKFYKFHSEIGKDFPQFFRKFSILFLKLLKSINLQKLELY